MELHERVARMEEHDIEQDRRIEKVESDNKLNHELLNEIKIMNINTTNQLNNISAEIGEVKQSSTKLDTKFDKLETKVDELEQKPQKLSLKAWVYVGCTVGGYILAELIELISSVI